MEGAIEDFRAAPARGLDHFEDLRLNLSDQDLIHEAVAVDHAQVNNEGTLARYTGHLDHFAVYLASAHGQSFYSAKRKHVLMFMKHLEVRGGSTPDARRVPCEWCRQRGYPDGRKGPGWSASYRKSHLSAIRFLYKHFAFEEDLPDRDPSAHVASPKVKAERGFTPTRDEVKRLLQAKGRPRDRLLAYWMFYAPSRRETFSNARWRDLDLDAGVWTIPTAKGDKVDEFDLHPMLVRELRAYRRWQLQQAQRNDALRSALSDPDTAFVLLTYSGRRVHPNTITKTIKWRAVRAGVAVKDAPGVRDVPGGQTSQVSPHALRRAWADIALNEEGVPLDVVAEALNHADVATTRRHYARTKPERARKAVRDLRL